MNFQKVKAAIFDLDGTLLDTLADIGTGANFALCQFGYEPYPIEAYRMKVGHGIKNLFRNALPADAPDSEIDRINAVYQQYYPANCTVHTDYFPGVKEFLQALSGKGIRLAVISNKTEGTGKKIMDHYFPDFEWAFVWGNNGQRPLKPRLEAGQLACEALQLQPEEILYVGDGDTDMEFASKMGFIAAGVTWGYRDPDQLLAAGADFLVDSFAELQEKIGL